MTSYLPTVFALLFGLIPSVSPDVENFINSFAAHNSTLVKFMIAGIWIAYHLLPSPIQGQITGSTPPKV